MHFLVVKNTFNAPSRHELKTKREIGELFLFGHLAAGSKGPQWFGMKFMPHSKQCLYSIQVSLSRRGSPQHWGLKAISLALRLSGAFAGEWRGTAKEVEVELRCLVLVTHRVRLSQ